MNKPAESIIEAVAPSYTVDDLKISDGYGVRNVAHAEQQNTMRLPRGGQYEATLVCAKKFYDGSAGGETGHYMLCYVEFRATGSRWRTMGVKIRQEEAARVAKALLTRKASKPSKNEDPRVGGYSTANDTSSLRVAPVGKGSMLIYVRHEWGGGWARKRGVEVLADEVAPVAKLLQQLAKVD